MRAKSLLKKRLPQKSQKNKCLEGMGFVGSAITIRRYRQGEEAEIKGMITSIMTKEYGDDVAAYPASDIDDLSTSYGGLGEAFFVALDQNKIVGTVGIKKEDDRIALLRRLFVIEPYRSRKIGLELINHALQFCYEVGYDEVIFKTTSKMTSAIQLCKKRGFVQRAKLKIGAIELLRFALSLRNGVKSSPVSA